MAVKLIAIDMDGTLLNSQHVISQENIKAIRWALSQGVEVAIATGRLGKELDETMALLPDVRYSIQANGAYLYDHANQKTIHSSAMSADDVRAIYDRLKTKDMMFEVFAEDGIYTNQSCIDDLAHYLVDDIKPLIDYTRIGIEDVGEYVRKRTGDVGKINIFFPSVCVRDEALSCVNDMLYSIVHQEVNSIEFNKLGMNKSVGLEALANHLGVQQEEVMAIGDGLNDLEMLRYAGVSVAMENAKEEAKEASRYETASCDKDGVAQAIYRFVK